MSKPVLVDIGTFVLAIDAPKLMEQGHFVFTIEVIPERRVNVKPDQGTFEMQLSRNRAIVFAEMVEQLKAMHHHTLSHPTFRANEWHVLLGGNNNSVCKIAVVKKDLTRQYKPQTCLDFGGY